MTSPYYLYNNTTLEHEFCGSSNQRFWFGYYNYCPIDDSGKYLLAHRWTSDDKERPFNSTDKLDVGYFSLDDNKWRYVASTYAANWQQGAMTQWIDLDGEQRIIFNDADGDRYVSRIYNKDGSLYKSLPFPIYGINEREQFSISINFERAYWCRAYHYEHIVREEYNKPVTDVDGAYRLDLRNGNYHKIIDINSVVQYDFRDEFTSGKHWIEHIMLNPSGTRFAFYHRFDCGTGFKTRCFVATTDGKILCCLKDWEKSSWSHLGWINDDQFVIFGIKRRPLGQVYSVATQSSGRIGQLLRSTYRKYVSRFVSPNLHHKVAASSCYEVYNVEAQRLGSFDQGLLVSDGHPSFFDNGRFMLTDTYADEEGYRNLFLFDVQKKKTILLARFYSHFNECGFRADLHPRTYLRNGKRYILVDSAHIGKHCMVVLKIDDALLKRDDV